MIRIIDAEEAHMHALLQIENACIAPPWSEGALLNEIGREDGLFAVAIEDGLDIEDGHAIKDDSVLGFCIIRNAADEAELYQLAVREDMRRQGIADSLMCAAKKFCQENKIGSIYLEVRKSNTSAIRLYKKHGFKNAGRRKNYYSSPVEDAVVMFLTLEPDYNFMA